MTNSFAHSFQHLDNGFVGARQCSFSLMQSLATNLSIHQVVSLTDNLWSECSDCFPTALSVPQEALYTQCLCSETLQYCKAHLHSALCEQSIAAPLQCNYFMAGLLDQICCCREAMNRLHEAIADYNEALALEPKSKEAKSKLLSAEQRLAEGSKGS